MSDVPLQVYTALRDGPPVCQRKTKLDQQLLATTTVISSQPFCFKILFRQRLLLRRAVKIACHWLSAMFTAVTV